MSPDAYLAALPWETRNLGIPAFALTERFFETPAAGDLKATLATLRSTHRDFFVQARFKPNSRTSQILEANGFYLVEAMLSPYAVLSRCAALARFAVAPSHAIPERYQTANLDVVALKGGDEDLATSVRRMAADSFVDDRFHLDHHCSADVASRRYQLWIGDLLHDATVRFQVLRLNARPIAFMASRAGDLLLAGFTRRYASAGLGEFFWLRALEQLKLDGVTSVRTRISTNNVAALNLYARLGFKFREPRSTFHCWARTLSSAD